MTIAACYLSPEGVVLGADSTTTYPGSTPHYFNNAQKLFEIGDGGTFGAVTWGLGGLNIHSYRALFGRLDSNLKKRPPKSVLEVARRWSALVWSVYNSKQSPLAVDFAECRRLASKNPFNPLGAATPNSRTRDEEGLLRAMSSALVVGFCIAGRLEHRQSSSAYEIIFDPLGGRPTPRQLPLGWQFWGAPNMIQRLIFGCDDGVKSAILGSGLWAGTPAELDQLVFAHTLQHPVVPIRDAIDFVHACISSTIKAFKFSNMAQICGGPIEIAVITSDRKFRWVRHKPWDAAINEGGL